MNRRHDIDALRALAFGFLILYHLGMLYVADWGWHIKSSYLSEGLQVPMLLLNRWRMDLIFLISGISTAFLMYKTSLANFLWQRNWRILLPLVFGIVVVVPIQPYCQGVANGMVAPGFVQFLSRYYTAAAWPAHAFAGWQHGYTWNHLWYLAYLWCYTTVWAVLQPLLHSSFGQRLQTAFTGMRGAKLLLLPALPLILYAATLKHHYPNTFELYNDWYVHANYFTMFVYGWCIAKSDRLWTELQRLRKTALALSIVSGAAYRAFVILGLESNGASTTTEWLGWSLRNTYVWVTICAILGWSYTCLNKPFRWLPWATESVYPWYILHQSLIILLAFWLIPLNLGPLAEPLIIGTGTVVNCWLLTTVLIARTTWLRPLVGLKPFKGMPMPNESYSHIRTPQQ